MTIATAICVASLIAQAVYLIVSIFVERTATTALVVLLVIETVPALLFLFLFAKEGSLANPVGTVQSLRNASSKTSSAAPLERRNTQNAQRAAPIRLKTKSQLNVAGTIETKEGPPAAD